MYQWRLLTNGNTTAESMRSKKFVLDANIWVSYFITQQFEQVALIVAENRVVIFICDELISELNHLDL